MEFQIRKRKRSKLPQYFTPRNPRVSTITEEEQAAEILLMISRDRSFLKIKPSSPESKPSIESTPFPKLKSESSMIKSASFPKSKPESSTKPTSFPKLKSESSIKSSSFPKSKPESSIKPASFPKSRPESSLRSEPASHECTTYGKRFLSHQALGGHKTMHNRPSLKRKRSQTEAPLINGVVPVLEKRGTLKRSESEAPFIPVVHATVPVPVLEKSGTLKSSESETPLVPVVQAAMSVPVQEKQTVSKTHVCKECGKIFPTGQALGGHMREHFKGVISHQKKKVKFEFDLNLPPDGGAGAA